MKVLILSVSIFATAWVFAEPSAPSAEQVADWTAFSKPVHLNAEKIDHGDFAQWGDPVWIYGYSAKKETLFTYVIGLYKAGTLFGKSRGEREKRIEDAIQKLKERAQEHPGQDNEEMAKRVRIETRPDGRKVYLVLWVSVLGVQVLRHSRQSGSTTFCWQRSETLNMVCRRIRS